MAPPCRFAAMAIALVLTPLSCLEVREQTDDAGVLVNPCVTCHGSADRSGPVENQAAPPIDLDGQRETSRPGVGAHQIHLSSWGTHGPIECRQCHMVPTSFDMMGHADSPPPAEFVPGNLARQGDRAAHYDSTARTCVDTYCHRSARPIWNEPRGSSAACGSCHGLPPEAPHVQIDDCTACHVDVVSGEPGSVIIIAPALHVDGIIQSNTP